MKEMTQEERLDYLVEEFKKDACLNYSEACCPRQIENRSIVIDGDSGEVIQLVLTNE